MNDILLIAGAGLVAGTMNAIAGGGSFVTLPALMAAGVPALNANASSTVALVPSALASAYAYRHDFQGFDGVSFRVMALLSVLGGACGAILLLVTPQSVFAILVPFLLLFGTLAFAFGRQAGAWLRQRVHITPHMMLACQFVLGIYGGYFGGAVGIMMLAAWSLLTSASIAAMQPARNLLNCGDERDRDHSLRRRRPRFLAPDFHPLRRRHHRRLFRRPLRPENRPGQGADRHFRSQRLHDRAGVLANFWRLIGKRFSPRSALLDDSNDAQNLFGAKKGEMTMLKSLIAAAVLVSAFAFTAAPASAEHYHHRHHHEHHHYHHHHNGM